MLKRAPLRKALGFATLLDLVLRAARLRVTALTLDDRLANIPLDDAPVTAAVDIRWSPHAVPFITAACLPDAAVGLGVVHAHLRLAQMEIMRRLAQGRISELIGPLGLDIDIALRTIDLPRAVPGMIAMLPTETRLWAQSFLAGINHVIAKAPLLPPELRLFGLERTPWTMTDLLAVGRLAAADFTWGLSMKLLKLRETMPQTAWACLWPELLGDVGPAPDGPLAAAARGSNSAAVSGARTASGKAIIASDPHVSVQLPSLWVACGVAAPGLHAAGLMIPGLPTIAIGRNRHIAWGATNLHAASSVFVDLAAEAAPGITTRTVDVAIRGAPTQSVTVRDSRFGPVISDCQLFGLNQPTALAWIGHRASDELTAMLGVNRAGNFAAFQQALRGYAVQGYSFTYADETGRVGILRAAAVPDRRQDPADITEPAGVVDNVVCLADTTSRFDPAEGFVVSANENPRTDVIAGFFYAPPDRAARQAALLNRHGITRADVEALQRDVAAPGALRLRDALAARAAALGVPLPKAILDWDGSYDESSIGALAYEVLIGEAERLVIGETVLAPLLAVWTGRDQIATRLLGAPEVTLRAALMAATRRARRAIAKGRTWGSAHRLTLGHPLARLPFMGTRFGAHVFGVPGSNTTLYKTGHGPVLFGRNQGRHRVSYGASARHLADFADIDDHFVAILGGQDGWVGSANAADQVGAWRAGNYLRLPLRAETVTAAFDRLTRLLPTTGNHP